MGMFTQPVAVRALHERLDEIVPDDGQIYWFDRLQPTNWGEDVEADDCNLSDENYIKKFRRIEASPLVRGYFLLFSPLYVLGETAEEIRAHELFLQGGVDPETFFEHTGDMVFLGETIEEALQMLEV